MLNIERFIHDYSSYTHIVPLFFLITILFAPIVVFYARIVVLLSLILLFDYDILNLATCRL